MADQNQKKVVRMNVALDQRRKVGEIGEGIVAGYLRRRGHIILARNYRKPWGELDIVSRKSGRIYVSEVKTVSRKPSHYRPEELIHVHKQRRIFRTMMSFLMDLRVGEDIPWQLDGYVVVLRKGLGGRVVGGTLKRIPNVIGG